MHVAICSGNVDTLIEHTSLMMKQQVAHIIVDMYAFHIVFSWPNQYDFVCSEPGYMSYFGACINWVCICIALLSKIIGIMLDAFASLLCQKCIIYWCKLI